MERWQFITVVIALYLGVTLATNPTANPAQVLIRAFGLAAIVLLHFILAIGPLARLNDRYLPLLYNRRHLGVMMFVLGFIHGGMALFWYHAFGTLNPILSVFVSDWGVHPGAFPFQAFGALALIILFVMAATSHDFWLTNLTAPVWKTLHMLVYVAYASLVVHVAFGVLQAETSPVYMGILALGAVILIGLHLTAAHRERVKDTPLSSSPAADGFIPVAKVADLPINEAISVLPSTAERAPSISASVYGTPTSLRARILSAVCSPSNSHSASHGNPGIFDSGTTSRGFTR